MGLEFERSIKGPVSLHSPSLWPWHPPSPTWAPGPLAQVTAFRLGVTAWGQRSWGVTFPFRNRLLFITSLLVLHLLRVPTGRMSQNGQTHYVFVFLLDISFFTLYFSWSLNINSVPIIPHFLLDYLGICPFHTLYSSYFSLSFCFVLHLDEDYRIN